MGVTRFRSIGDMPSHPPPADTPLEGLRAACALSMASQAFGHEALAPRGVHKFRSVAQAWDHRRQWEEAVIRQAAAPDPRPA
ncbi:hypothetical protein BH24ACT15_BH24ACT15_32570 [soil metagenome]